MQPQYHNDSDAFLALLSSEEKALAYFFNRHYTALVYYGNSILSDNSTAEEIASSSFLKLWQKRASLRSATGVKAFLYKMVHNAAVDHLRLKKTQAKRKRSLFYSSNSFEHSHLQTIIEAETFHNLSLLISKLPPQAGKIFQMHIWQKKEYTEIAKELGISAQTARNQKQRAIQLLKKYASGLSVLSILILSSF